MVNKMQNTAMQNRNSKQFMFRKKSVWTNYFLLKEDNVRFVLLAVVIIIYMVLGAAVFQALEEHFEIAQVKGFQESLSKQISNMVGNLESRNATIEQVESLMYLWGNATLDGLVSSNRRWDYGGSFHFVYTVVSTIGFGAATPKTTPGRIFLIFYGLLGCSSGILFFNLFLERIITLLAFIMKMNYKRKVHPRAGDAGESASVASQDTLDSWKPSVYWVMFYLCFTSVVVAALASVMYMKIEQWTYMNSVYFCFVTFATIGFGDFVSAQREESFYGTSIHAYQFGNFFVMVLGCCCIYSLFNVTSIVIKQTLNWIIQRLAICCHGDDELPSPERNGITLAIVEKPPNQELTIDHSEAERKLSGQVLTLREYVSSQQTSAKTNWEGGGEQGTKEDVENPEHIHPYTSKNFFFSYNRSPPWKINANSSSSTMPPKRDLSSASSRRSARGSLIPGQVGPLAIATSKFLGEN